MPSRDPDAVDGGDLPKAGPWQRFTGALSNFMLKPADAGPKERRPTSDTEGPTTVPEIEAAIKRADDKERNIGLVAAPLAAGIGLLITSSLVANDPKARLANGHVNTLHVSPSTYVEFGLVAMGLAVLMLAMAWFRKRLYLGIATALYGLSLFNLHYPGFGVPFVLVGAWYLVRAYRLQQKLKVAKAADGVGYGPTPTRPQPSKRYTPPVAPPRRSPKPKRGKELEAG
jgi:hypothetical protein